MPRLQKQDIKLNSRASHINRKLTKFHPPGYNTNVYAMLLSAGRKMIPIVQTLVETPPDHDHFLGPKQCNDLETISTVISDALKALQTIGFETKIQPINVRMEKYRDTPGDQGKVYVDTKLLLQILEMYNCLEQIKDEIETFYKSIGVHSLVQTESGQTFMSSIQSFTPNKLVFKLKKPLLEELSSFGLLRNEFPGMSSFQLFPITGSKSEILNTVTYPVVDTASVRASKSEASLDVKVTDVYGARHILAKCIYDLQEVSNYLNIPRKDVSTTCSRAEVDTEPRVSDTKRGSKESKSHHRKSESDGERCTCKDCYGHPDKAGGHFKNEEDQVVICIKGCNEDEGDVQIVIRQCPDCKRGKTDESGRRESKPTSEVPMVHKEVQPASEEEHVMLKPAESASEIASTKHHEHDDDNVSTQNHVKVGCSKIRFFESTNLCLKTDTGEELVISLTVTPKEGAAKNPSKLSIRDIFSENVSYEQQRTRPNSISSKPEAYFVDRYIPLVRTKICSSLEFDVATESTKIKDKGIMNKNNNIVVQLQELGMDKLLRACRPAKCCRKAILNEKMKKCLPYTPSLRSLPLDEEDMRVIGQSLQMSLQKVKNSTNLAKEYVTMYFVVETDWKVASFLSYYINLVDDVPAAKVQYDVAYFGVQAEEMDKSKYYKYDQKPAVASLTNSPNGQRKKRTTSKIPVYQKPKPKLVDNFRLYPDLSIPSVRNPSKCSTVSGGAKKNKRRKKREYYLSKSRSETSVVSLHSDRQYSSTVQNQECDKASSCGSLEGALILDYLSRLLYDMIAGRMLRVKDAGVETDDATSTGVLSFQEVYRRKIDATVFCQTSKSLLTYLGAWPHYNIGKKRLFKTSYDRDGNSNSCQTVENFIVTFESNESFNNRSSIASMSSLPEDSLSRSLLKLKETLEKYENVKNEIDSNAVNPIEYFVYQVCACNGKLPRKPSLMQKIASKTKGLFSSVEMDICKKYKNQQGCLNKSPEDKTKCHLCGCYINKCGHSMLCQCPPEYKSKKPSFVQEKRAKRKTKMSASAASLKSSVSNGTSKKQQAENERNESITVCLPPNVQTVKCDQQTATTKDSATQKCACDKCQIFREDGTCCCSHCLGGLDKSPEAKPDNSHAAVGTDTAEPPPPPPPSSTIETVSSEEVSTEAPPTVIEMGGSDDSGGTETTTFFFVTPGANLFNRFRNNGNPFGPRSCNVPEANLFRLDNDFSHN